eukprot:scaffold22833_cov134-Isochrysis_galbana.AAC.6
MAPLLSTLRADVVCLVVDPSFYCARRLTQSSEYSVDRVASSTKCSGSSSSRRALSLTTRQPSLRRVTPRAYDYMVSLSERMVDMCIVAKKIMDIYH